MVEQARQRSSWPSSRTLRVLEIPRSTYQRWRKAAPLWRAAPRSSPGCLFALLPSEERAIRKYALEHPEIRHRELAWRMLDEGVCAVSSSSVYRVLRKANLVCRWQPSAKAKGKGREARPTRPDQQWQTDIKYIRGGGGGT